MLVEWKRFAWLVAVISCGTTQLQPDPSIRLVDRNGPNPFQGRVEVFYEGPNDKDESVSGWFTVCDDHWDGRDAGVVCRQLGFRGATGAYYSSYFGAGSTPIAMDQVRCSGRETRLQDCEFDGWFKHDCKHTEDAGVRCVAYDPASRVLLPVRLALAGSDTEGIVEIQYEGSWGAIDKWHFGDENARVTCGQLGYPNGTSDSCTTEECGVYNGSLIARGFMCIGRETTLSSCKLMHWGPFDENDSDYNTSDLAYIRCSKPPRSVTPTEPTISMKRCNSPTTKKARASSGVDLQLRLRGGTGPWEGRVEIFSTSDWNHGEWSPLCDRDWNQYSANAVCRQLGYGTARTVHRGSYFGRGVGYTYNRVFECHGNESMMSQCRVKDVGWYGCKHWQEAGVECYKPSKVSERVRLADRVRIYSGYAGFVEVKDDTCNKWYHVCDEGWGLPQARVICRELKLGFGSMGRSKPGSTKNYKDFVSDKYQCTGNELQLSDCMKETISTDHLRCNAGVKLKGTDIRDVQKEDVGNQSAVTPRERDRCDAGFAWVECVSRLPDLIPDVRELRRSMAAYPHRVTVGGLPCALEEGCFGKSASRHRGSYEHERFLVRFTTRVMNLGRAPFEPHQPREKWKWHSCHKHYHSFEAFTIYHVIDKCGRQVAEGHKASFCLEDSHCEERGPTPRVYYNCRGARGGRQGISVNCADSYRNSIDCQWVDMTDVPYGNYRLVIDVNPHRRVAETDFSNNVAYCDFRYYGSWWQIKVDECGIDPNWKSPEANE